MDIRYIPAKEDILQCERKCLKCKLVIPLYEYFEAEGKNRTEEAVRCKMAISIYPYIVPEYHIILKEEWFEDKVDYSPHQPLMAFQITADIYNVEEMNDAFERIAREIKAVSVRKA